ncbi:hypothetical protein ABTX35_11970 [Streptomyces sp. NPDC096080]|uniref:hypothetical protein n=1 Tax=Streptomyces sp. NPDC096080 TaxID=3156693 RepID=UPI00332C3D37
MPRDLTTAQQELADARATLAALEEQVRDGADVTPQQLSGQRELISFAELRVEAAQRTEARMREDERVALAAAAKTAALELIAGEGMVEIAAAARTAADALAAVTALVAARNTAIAEVGTSLVDLDTDLVVNAGAKGPWASKVYGVWGNREALVVPGTGRVDRLELEKLAALIAAAGLGATDEGLGDVKALGDTLTKLPNLTIRGLLEAYPQLADEFRATEEEFSAASQRGQYALSEQGRRPAQTEG